MTHAKITTGQRATRRRSQVSISDSDPDLPPAKKRKAEKTIAFDEANAENKDLQNDRLSARFEQVVHLSLQEVLHTSHRC